VKKNNVPAKTIFVLVDGGACNYLDKETICKDRAGNFGAGGDVYARQIYNGGATRWEKHACSGSAIYAVWHKRQPSERAILILQRWRT